MKEDEKQLKPVGMLTGDKWDKMHDISRRVYDEEGVCPTIPTTGGGNHEVKVVVREATKKGYAEAYEGDSIDISYPASKTRRGRVGKGVAHTILAQGEGQVVVVGALRGRNPENPSDRTAGAPTEQRLELRKDECTNTITTVQKDNVVIETAGIYTRASSAFQRGPLPDKSRSIRAGCDDAGVIVLNGKRCVVRKLTPKECWRLFGFTDEQYEAAKTALERVHYGGKSKASSQLYKQAGNTIVIPMLEAVLSKVKGIAVRIKGESK